MYVYLDESGDAGFEFKRGSSRYFVVALMLVDDPRPLREAVSTYRREIGWPKHREFKFAKASHEIRRDFLSAIRFQPLTIRCLVVDKEALLVADPRVRRDAYVAMIRSALQEALQDVTMAHVIIDESFEGRSKKASFSSDLRHAVSNPTGRGARTLRAVSYRRSRSDDLLQAADMIVGAIAYAHKHDNHVYRRIIQSKIAVERFLPEME
jgi:hypothetical protein